MNIVGTPQKLFMGVHNISQIKQSVLNLELQLWKPKIGLKTIEMFFKKINRKLYDSHELLLIHGQPEKIRVVSKTPQALDAKPVSG